MGWMATIDNANRLSNSNLIPNVLAHAGLALPPKPQLTPMAGRRLPRFARIDEPLFESAVHPPRDTTCLPSFSLACVAATGQLGHKITLPAVFCHIEPGHLCIRQHIYDFWKQIVAERQLLAGG